MITAVPYQDSSVLNTSNNNDNSTTTSSENLPPYSIPFTISLLISESLFPDVYSPASTLIIPFIRVDIPYGYFIIIVMELVTAYLAKLSYGPSYSILTFGRNTEVPNIEALRKSLSQPSVTRSAREQPGRGRGRGSVLNTADRSLLTDSESTPLLPLGMTFNLSFLSPFTAPTSRTSTLFTIELKEIKNVPGYILPLAALALYFVLRPYFKAKQQNNGTTANS